MRLYVNVKFISHSVGQGFAPAVRLLLMYDGLRILSNENASRIKPSSDGQRMRPPPAADKGSICWRSGRFCAALQAA